MSNIKKLMVSAGGGAGLDVDEVFSTYLYEGNNGTAQSITNGIDLSGEGGLVWIKQRTQNNYHYLFDPQVTGNTSALLLPLTSIGTSAITTALTSFNSNGFSLGSSAGVNGTHDMVSWTFRKAPKFFDIVTYTGNGVGDDRTISHNLGSTPGMMIVKRTNGSGDWYVYHRGLNISGAAPEDQFLTLDSTYGSGNSPWAWNDTAPTDTGFTVKTAISNVNGANYVAYLFAHHNNDGEFGPNGDQDIIKCGSYTGNGSSTGPVINLGFEPQWLLIKNASASANWQLVDNMRDFRSPKINVGLQALKPNLTNAEAEGRAYGSTATGFSIVDNHNDVNASGKSYIYMAIRRGPLAVPEDATKVFDIDLANPGSSTITTPFPVDLNLAAKRTGSVANFSTIDRLRGGKGLRTSQADEEQNITVTLDSMDSFQNNIFGSGNHLFYSWKRAPSFCDVVAYRGNGTAGRTINHNLGAAPEMIWVKILDSAQWWRVYHSGTGATKFFYLNRSDAASTNSGPWNNTAPTDTVFTVGNDSGTNQNNYNFIAYLFASAPGVSKVGSYTGNGGTTASGDGQDIDCGFSSGARFVLIKPSNADDNWFVFDSARGIVAGNDPYMRLNTDQGETSTSDEIDPLNSGFRILNRNNQLNRTGREYIFYAIA